MASQSKIRNFCIIAHIDHGKSTLADRLLEITGAVAKRAMREQILDTMELEREKGITIKLQPVRLQWQGHELNLIDTPGHVDFSYEVSRSLTACEGAVLVVDSTQGIQAQTLANVYLAIEAGLEIIPVVNKIDLPAADPERVSSEIAELIGCKPQEVIQVSAKTGQNVKKILNSIVAKVPAPVGQADMKLRCLVFDSIYDEHRGVILYVRVVDGQLSKGSSIKLMGAKTNGLANEVGSFSPAPKPQPQLSCGEIGYIVTNLKAVEEARVGDTVTMVAAPATEPLAGYQDIKPFVYAGFFPASSEQQPLLKEALQRLKLNDASLQFEPESSPVLGFGFRIGFLGLLH
ncbi:MAG TPA: GTP-binding protein, partial [Candidatus Babeliales bacterium]|nr:GTP-binding protein [Candidatus Babeliales bacterium]